MIRFSLPWPNDTEIGANVQGFPGAIELRVFDSIAPGDFVDSALRHADAPFPFPCRAWHGTRRHCIDRNNAVKNNARRRVPTPRSHFRMDENVPPHRPSPGEKDGPAMRDPELSYGCAGSSMAFCIGSRPYAQRSERRRRILRRRCYTSETRMASQVFFFR